MAKVIQTDLHQRISRCSTKTNCLFLLSGVLFERCKGRKLLNWSLCSAAMYQISYIDIQRLEGLCLRELRTML